MSDSPLMRPLDAITHHVHETLDPQEVIEIVNRQEIHNFKLGMIFLLVAITTWIIGLELVNVVIKGDEFDKPFFIAFLVGSFFSMNLVPDLISRNHPQEECEPTQDPLNRKETIVLAAQVSIVYYIYNLCMMMSLRYTTPSNSTVLSASSSIFTLFVGAFLGIDTLTTKKLFCVVCSILGVFMVTYADASTQNGGNKFELTNPVLGNSLAVLAALAYSMYLVIVEVKTLGRLCNERQLFGYVGLCTAFLGCPVLFIAHISGMETLSGFPTKKVLILVLVNAFFSVVSDFTTVIAMLLTSPLVTSLLLTSAIPITVFIDYIIISVDIGEPQSKPLGYFVGIVSILASVILINLNMSTEDDLIEKVIDQTLQNAVRDDELLSPVLSPLMSPSLDGSSSTKMDVRSLRLRMSPRMSPRLARDDHISPWTSPRDNMEHLALGKPRSKLYITQTADDVNEENQPELTVYSSGHHKYVVRKSQSGD